MLLTVSSKEVFFIGLQAIIPVNRFNCSYLSYKDGAVKVSVNKSYLCLYRRQVGILGASITCPLSLVCPDAMQPAPNIIVMSTSILWL